MDLFWADTGVNDIEGMLPVLARGARVVVMSGLTARPAVPMGMRYTHDISLHGFAISNASVGDLVTVAALINRLLAAGWLRGRIGTTLPWRKPPARTPSLRRGGSDRTRGRTVVRP